MKLGRRRLLAGATTAAATSTYVPFAAKAQVRPIRIGVLTDLSSRYRDLVGDMSVAAARQAIADFGSAGIAAVLVVADLQSRPDVALSVARHGFGRDDVDAIVDVPSSSAALAITTLARERNKVLLVTSASTTELTGAQCSPNTVHWSYNTYMNAKSTGGALTEAGGTSWFIIAADYAFGQRVTADIKTIVAQKGGTSLNFAMFDRDAEATHHARRGCAIGRGDGRQSSAA
ncbi:MAG: branched-chain amino acid transport system substrate-binding protein [Acetobacteraceae bacterium]|jgi:branched-chain amino acid transport system substrate-binding protein|nr:branched-chain amino acid transport system substrate-binding protein [Acetobacteraceae bacterium]